MKRSVSAGQIVSADLQGTITEERVPKYIRDMKMVKGWNTTTTKVLVQWSNGSSQEVTWEFLCDL